MDFRICHHSFGKSGEILWISDYNEKTLEALKFKGFLLVGETGFEPAAT